MEEIKPPWEMLQAKTPCRSGQGGWSHSQQLTSPPVESWVCSLLPLAPCEGAEQCGLLCRCNPFCWALLPVRAFTKVWAALFWLWKGAASPATPRAVQWPAKGGRAVHAAFKSLCCAVNDSFVSRTTWLPKEQPCPKQLQLSGCVPGLLVCRAPPSQQPWRQVWCGIHYCHSQQLCSSPLLQLCLSGHSHPIQISCAVGDSPWGPGVRFPAWRMGWSVGFVPSLWQITLVYSQVRKNGDLGGI